MDGNSGATVNDALLNAYFEQGGNSPESFSMLRIQDLREAVDILAPWMRGSTKFQRDQPLSLGILPHCTTPTTCFYVRIIRYSRCQNLPLEVWTIQIEQGRLITLAFVQQFLDPDATLQRHRGHRPSKASTGQHRHASANTL